LGRESMDSRVCGWTTEETPFSEIPNPKTVLFYSYSGGSALPKPIDNPWVWFSNYFSLTSYWRAWEEDPLPIVSAGKYVFFPRPNEVITPFKPPIRLFVNDTYNLPDAFTMRGSEVYGFFFDSFERDPNLWMLAVNQFLVVTKPDGTTVSKIPGGPSDYSGTWGLDDGIIAFLNGGQPSLEIGLDVGNYAIDWRVIGSFDEDLCANATVYFDGNHYEILSKASGYLVDDECVPFEGAIPEENPKGQLGNLPANDYLVKSGSEAEQCGLICGISRFFDDFFSSFLK